MIYKKAITFLMLSMVVCSTFSANALTIDKVKGDNTTHNNYTRRYEENNNQNKQDKEYHQEYNKEYNKIYNKEYSKEYNKEYNKEYDIDENNFKLNINGENHFSSYFTKSKDKDLKGGLSNEAQLSITATSIFNDELSYGANAQVSLNSDKLSADQMYIFLDSTYGRFELGNYKSAGEALKFDASSIATIEGGIGNSSIASIGGINTDTTKFYTLPHLYTSYERKAKGYLYPNTVTFYTQDSLGPLKIGVSYINGGNSNANILTPKPTYNHVINAGALYENESDNLKYKFSLTGEAGSSNGENLNNISGINFGAGLQYAGLKIAGSYGNLAQSGLQKTFTDKDSSHFFTLGTSYEVGHAMTSLTYFSGSGLNSTKNKTKFNVLSLGTHYNLTGKIFKFTPYMALNFFRSEVDTSNLLNNEGYMFLTGIKVLY